MLEVLISISIVIILMILTPIFQSISINSSSISSDILTITIIISFTLLSTKIEKSKFLNATTKEGWR